MKFDDKFNNLTEAYLKIPARRLMYPRGLSLSEEFVTAFNAECGRLVDEGQDPRKLCERVSKALQFHYSVAEESPEEMAPATNYELRQVDEEEQVDEVAGVVASHLAGRAAAGHVAKKGGSKVVQDIAGQVAGDAAEGAVDKITKKADEKTKHGG